MRNATYILFTQFEQSPQEKGKVILNKKSQPVQRFLPVKEYVGVTFLLHFLEYIAPSIIHHGTLLTLYQNFKTSFFDHLDCEFINIDFTENLTIDIKWEPQSLH